MAIANAERFQRLYPQSPHMDYALYLQGVVQFNQNGTWLSKKMQVNPAEENTDSLKNAFVAFNQLVKLYPKSRYAPDALKRLYYIRNVIARHQMIIARYYFKRKAYVAAANRAGFIVQHYSGTDSTADALAMLVKSYRHLNLPKLANTTYAILKQNNPAVAARL